MPSLSQSYRPKRFSEITGQTHIVRVLTNAISKNRIAHAYLFTGSRGTGKTTMARIFARAVNCAARKNSEACSVCASCIAIAAGNSLNVTEIDAASYTGVDNIRQVREEMPTPPTDAPYKVYIIDEAHMLSTGAWNALLKTLEEPPAHIIIILATTEVHKIPETILSRCQRFDFARFSFAEISEKIRRIAKNEGVHIEDAAIEMITQSAEGGMRDAESLLSQVMSLEDKTITSSEVQDILGIANQQTIRDAALFLVKHETADALKLLTNIVREGYDMSAFAKSLISFFRAALLFVVTEGRTVEEDVSSEDKRVFEEMLPAASVQWILQTIDHLSLAESRVRASFLPHLPLEIAFVKISFPFQKNEKETLTKTPSEKKSDTGDGVNESEKKEKKVEKKKADETQEKKSIEKKTEKETKKKETKSANAEAVEFHAITQIWPAIMDEVKRNYPSIAVSLSHCAPTRVEEKNIAIIATRFSFYRERLNETGVRLTCEKIFSTLIGSPVRIQFVEEAEGDERKAQEVSEPSSDGKQDGVLLQDAMKIFGSEAA